MTTRDLISGLGLGNGIAPDRYSASVVGSPVDLKNFDSAFLSLSIGAGGITFDPTNNRIDIILEASSDGVTYTPVSQSDIQASSGTTVTVGTGGIVRSLTAAKPAADVMKVGYIGTARYLRPRALFTGTHGTGTGICANIVSGHAHQRPVA